MVEVIFYHNNLLSIFRTETYFLFSSTISSLSDNDRNVRNSNIKSFKEAFSGNDKNDPFHNIKRSYHYQKSLTTSAIGRDLHF